MGAEFKRRGKEAFEGLILRQRFEDTQDRKILFKRRDDWIKDLNLNLVKGKVIKSTHYFDEIENLDKIKLLRALDTEAGPERDTTLIEPLVRSMSVFKPYAEFSSSDFAPILQEMKLLKFRRGKRVCNFGKNADHMYFILGGRIAITHPNKKLMNLFKDGPKAVEE